MLRDVLNKFWKQQPTKQQLYDHLPPIMKTIKVRRTRHTGHCWRSKDELISDILLRTPSFRRAKVGQPAKTDINRSVTMQDLAWKTSWERWTIETGGERGSERFVQTVCHDDDDDDTQTHDSILWEFIIKLSWPLKYALNQVNNSLCIVIVFRIDVFRIWMRPYVESQPLDTIHENQKKYFYIRRFFFSSIQNLSFTQNFDLGNFFFHVSLLLIYHTFFFL